MKAEIAERIRLINKGQVPEGYNRETSYFYNTDWNFTTISEVMEIRNNLRLPISEEERKHIQGKYPYYGPTKIQGYIDRFTIEGEHVLIGEDGDHFLKYKDKEMTLLIDGKFNVNNHAHILKGTDLCTTKWFYYYFQNRDIFSSLTRQGAGRYKLTKDALMKMKIVVPPLPEQQKIASILSTWDKAIELKEKLISEKKNQKTALMQELLTGKKRLNGFDGEWEEVRLGDVLKSRVEKSEITDELELFSLTIERGVTPKTDRYNREFLVVSDNKKYKIAKYNDIVYNPSNLRYGAIALNKNKAPVLLSPIYEVLELKNMSNNIEYLAYLLTWDRNISYYETKAEGTLVERMAVKIDTFLNISFSMATSIPEQTAIANILSLADKEISLLEKDLEALKEQKKGLMQLLLTGIVRVN